MPNSRIFVLSLLLLISASASAATRLPQWGNRSYYEILGVPGSASHLEIKSAFRTLAKKFHPDHNRGDKAAEGEFKAVAEAWEVLGNESKRRDYDRAGATYAERSPPANANAATSWNLQEMELATAAMSAATRHNGAWIPEYEIDLLQSQLRRNYAREPARLSLVITKYLRQDYVNAILIRAAVKFWLIEGGDGERGYVNMYRDFILRRRASVLNLSRHPYLPERQKRQEEEKIRNFEALLSYIDAIEKIFYPEPPSFYQRVRSACAEYLKTAGLMRGL